MEKYRKEWEEGPDKEYLTCQSNLPSVVFASILHHLCLDYHISLLTGFSSAFQINLHAADILIFFEM